MVFILKHKHLGLRGRREACLRPHYPGRSSLLPETGKQKPRGGHRRTHRDSSPRCVPARNEQLLSTYYERAGRTPAQPYYGGANPAGLRGGGRPTGPIQDSNPRAARSIWRSTRRGTTNIGVRSARLAPLAFPRADDFRFPKPTKFRNNLTSQKMRQRESVFRHHVLVARKGPAYGVMSARRSQAKAANRRAAQVTPGQ